MPHIQIPNSAALHTLPSWAKLNDFHFENLNQAFTIGASTNFVFTQPFALAQLAAWGEEVNRAGGSVTWDGNQVNGLPYAVRMGLFKFLHAEHDLDVEEHEPSGRFVPLTNIRTAHQLDDFLTELYPLFHIPKASQDAIQYCLSELTRNVLEHSNSFRGAFACAQYFANSDTVSIGVADCGWGMRHTISRNYDVDSDKQAILTALRPGTSGAPKEGNMLGTENAGAGLFFTKTISRLGNRQFGLISGDAMYRLRKQQPNRRIHTDPTKDNHRTENGLQNWKGTVVGLDVNTNAARNFDRILALIREAFGQSTSVAKTDFSGQVRFS